LFLRKSVLLVVIFIGRYIKHEIYIYMYRSTNILNMGVITKVGSAKKGTKSLKSTIPESIVEFLKLKDKDEVEWQMETQNDDRVVVIKKK
jgi:hypothetical protein